MKHRIILTLLTGLIALTGLSNPVRINEIMQSNIDMIMDDLNDFPDSWVEIINTSDTAVNLTGYSIGDSSKPGKAYRLPAAEIAPGGKMLIYCDKVGKGFHTDFRLESGKGCEVYLFCNDSVADSVSGLKKQPAPNVAYGRITDGADEWGYMAVATPGESNCGQIVTTLLPDPIFSVPGRIGTEPLTLSISMPDDAPEGTKIHYTLDGTEPTAASPVWTEPLHIESSTVVRALPVCDGFITPRSVTQSYIFFPHDTSLHFVSLVTDPDYFYSPDIGIYVTGNSAEGPNYEADWRRPLNVEFFTAKDTDAVINQLAETKVKGGASRQFTLKSLVLYANKRFGEKRFNCEFFPEASPGISEFKSVELRNAGNDFYRAVMRDAVIQHSMGMNTDLDWQPHQGTVVFLNGQYFGFMNLRPRSNEDYVEAYYDGLEDIDMVENWQGIVQGNMDTFWEFRKFYIEKGHTLEEYRELMDVDEFANLFIMDIFYDNKDFPYGNIIQWRPKAEGGKWRWIAKDTDFGLGLTSDADYRTLSWITNQHTDSEFYWGNNPIATEMFKNMLEIDEFREQFIDRFAVYMGDFLRADRVVDIIDREAAQITDEVLRTRRHYSINISEADYFNEIDAMRAWATHRAPAVYSQLSEYFGLGKPVDLLINTAGTQLSDISFNGITLSDTYFDGQWFAGRPLTITSTDPAFNEWHITAGRDGVSLTINSKTISLTLDDCDYIEINPVYSPFVGIEAPAAPEQQAAFDGSSPFSAVSITGVHLGEFADIASFKATALPGVYIIRQGNSCLKLAI